MILCGWHVYCLTQVYFARSLYWAIGYIKIGNRKKNIRRRYFFEFRHDIRKFSTTKKQTLNITILYHNLNLFTVSLCVENFNDSSLQGYAYYVYGEKTD